MSFVELYKNDFMLKNYRIVAIDSLWVVFKYIEGQYEEIISYISLRDAKNFVLNRI